MPVTVNINGLSCVHKTSGGTAVATLPDVCKTPPNALPIPYPNIALSSDLVGGTATITVDGSPAAVQSSMFVKSTGDEAGALGGVVSQVFAMEATFLSFSPTVIFEGQPVCRLTDKMLMNKGNTVCMSGEIQGLVIAPDTLPPVSLLPLMPEEPMFCLVDTLIFSCGHGDRGYTVDLLTEDLPALQVISTRHEPEKLIVSTSTSTSCGFGNEYCPTIMLGNKSNAQWTAFDPTKPIELSPQDNEVTFIDLIERMIFNAEVPRETYIVRPMICNGEAGPYVPLNEWTTIEVFNEMEFKMGVTLGWAHPAVDEKKLMFIYEPQKSFKLGGSLEGKYGRKSFKIEADSTKAPSGALPLIGTLIEKIGKSIFLFDMIVRFGEDVTGAIKFPEVSASGGIELSERKGKPLVGPKGSIKISCAPLIGFTLKVSLLNLLLRYGGPLFGPGAAGVCSCLLLLKEHFASDPKSFEVEIDMTIDDDIRGDIGIEYDWEKVEPSGTIGGGIGLQLEGRVVGAAKVFFVEFAGAGKIGLAAAKGEGSEPSRFGAKLNAALSDGQPILDGELYFTGVAFYYLFYMEVAIAGAESEKKDTTAPKSKTLPAEGENADERKKPKTSSKRSNRKEYKGSSLLMEPWSWKYPLIKPIEPKSDPARAAGGGEDGGGGEGGAGGAGGGGGPANDGAGGAGGM